MGSLNEKNLNETFYFMKQKRWHVMQCHYPLLRPQFRHTNPSGKPHKNQLVKKIVECIVYQFKNLFGAEKNEKYIECSNYKVNDAE